jgi:hypothetical protein
MQKTALVVRGNEFALCRSDRNVTEYLSLMGDKVDSKG